MDKKISNVKIRILEFAKYQGLKKGEIARKIGMSYHSFKTAALHKTLNSNAVEALLTQYPKLSPDWLLMGKGPMLRVVSEPGAAPGEIQQATQQVETEVTKKYVTMLEEANEAHKRLAEMGTKLAESYLKIRDLSIQLAQAEAALKQAQTQRLPDKQAGTE